MKVLLKSAFSPYGGYGQDGLGIAAALLDMGLDVYLHPTNLSPPIPARIAALLTRPLEAPFDLMIHHADPEQLGLDPPARRAVDVAVAWTMWEYSSFDAVKFRRQLRKRLSLYDLVLGYDAVTAGALEPHLNGPQLGVVQGGYWPQTYPKVERDWHSERFGFMMEGQLHSRKDPFLAIAAFSELKQENSDFGAAELHLKTNILGLHPAMETVIDKLRVHYSVWPDTVMRQFYAAQHVLLAPSRGEGKNLPALQMLSSGGTVIATNWSGHQQWLSSEYAYPLDYELRPVSPQTPNCVNARASKEHLKQLMLHVYRNRTEAKQKGDTAANLIPQLCGWPAVMDRFFLRLADLIPGKGERLLAEARLARAKAKEQAVMLANA